MDLFGSVQGPVAGFFVNANEFWFWAYEVGSFGSVQGPVAGFCKP
jgi:hypothetical protein